jgi:hypothetical protein
VYVFGEVGLCVVVPVCVFGLCVCGVCLVRGCVCVVCLVCCVCVCVGGGCRRVLECV